MGTIGLDHRGDPGPPPTRTEVRALARRVQDKEPGALAAFTALAESHPAPVCDAMCVDLSHATRTTFARKTTGGDGAYSVALETKMELLIRELAGERPSPALRLVSEATAFEWCQHWTLAALAAQQGIGQATPMSLKRQQAALRRYLTALRTYQQIAALEGKGR